MKRLTLLVSAFALTSPFWLSAQSPLPSPESVLGFAPGSDYKLFNYEQSIAYFKKLDAASSAMMLVEAGKSSQGRTFYFALISNPKNLARIDRYREISRRLAHPEGLSDAEARQLAREGKPFVHIDGGLHATEIAGPQMMPRLAYDLLSKAAEPETAEILDNVIFMLWPTINPDGQSMVADWYMSHDPGPNAPQAPGMPYLYQEYVGHDNNRDAYMMNMIESRVMEHAWREWEPSIVYVQHQAPPNPYRIWLPPFAEPIATHAPPIPSAEINMLGMAIARGMDERGQTGATHMLATYDAWYPGYIDYNPIFKNIPAFWTETAGPSANPGRVANVPADLQIPHALYVNPFLGGEWHLRDAVAIDETAAWSVLEYAAKYKTNLLYNRYQSGRDQIAKGRNQAPYAYVVPQAQHDPVAAVEMLRRLAFSGVRVSQLGAASTIDGKSYPAGTWVIPTDQEFTALTRELLDPQKYPDIRESPNGPLDTPYDAAGWTLPMQMGVDVAVAATPLSAEARSAMKVLGPALDLKAKPTPYNMPFGGLGSAATGRSAALSAGAPDADVSAFDSVPGAGFDSRPMAAAIVPPAGRVTGTGPSLAVNPAENNAFRAINRAIKAGLDVQYVPATGSGSSRYVINGMPEADQNALVKSLALTAERVGAAPGAMKRPRIALINAPTGMDEGWTRWVLDQYGFEYTRLAPTDVDAGGLRSKFDVIIMSDDASGALQGGGRGGGRGGGAPGGGGAGAAGTPGAGVGQGPAGIAVNAPAAPPAGGQRGRGNPAAPNPANEARITAIDEFVKGGGTLVCFNRASTFAIDQLHLPVKNAIAGVNRTQFFVGGSLLNVTTTPAHRVMAGMPEQAAVFYDSGPVFETQDGFKGTVLAKYADAGSPLASGFLLGETYLQGKAAALDVELGTGHVVLLGFRPQWRGQPFGTFRVIFNAALFVQ